MFKRIKLKRLKKTQEQQPYRLRSLSKPQVPLDKGCTLKNLLSTPTKNTLNFLLSNPLIVTENIYFIITTILNIYYKRLMAKNINKIEIKRITKIITFICKNDIFYKVEDIAFNYFIAIIILEKNTYIEYLLITYCYNSIRQNKHILINIKRNDILDKVKHNIHIDNNSIISIGYNYLEIDYNNYYF